uniref:Uncharacterized protein n=1 Tax=Lophocladia kuetzingii TaxID=675577 RepID=A0A1Z1MPB7_9FLOR|nr:hypothetical protein [Lophocladia kuetzingii]ARW67692.1 hypothetical protein [Lophocladia kuetzingii]
MKKRNLLYLLTMIPQLVPIGLYIDGDREVLGIKTHNDKMTEYRIPTDSKGDRIILNNNTHSPFFIYASKNRSEFEKILNPPANEDTVMKNNLISLSDKKLLVLVHYLFTSNMPNRRIKIQDTAKMLSIIIYFFLFINLLTNSPETHNWI